MIPPPKYAYAWPPPRQRQCARRRYRCLRRQERQAMLISATRLYLLGILIFISLASAHGEEDAGRLKAERHYFRRRPIFSLGAAAAFIFSDDYFRQNARAAMRRSDRSYRPPIYVYCACKPRARAASRPPMLMPPLSTLHYVNDRAFLPRLVEVTDGALHIFATRARAGDGFSA